MKPLLKNKYLFKLYNIWKLFRSNSYCLLTSQTKTKSVMVDGAMINIFTDRQLDDLLSRASLFVKDNELVSSNMDAVLKEADQILNSKV